MTGWPAIWPTDLLTHSPSHSLNLSHTPTHSLAEALTDKLIAMFSMSKGVVIGRGSGSLWPLQNTRTHEQTDTYTHKHGGGGENTLLHLLPIFIIFMANEYLFSIKSPDPVRRLLSRIRCHVCLYPDRIRNADTRPQPSRDPEMAMDLSITW